jgi:hypothetical protein
MKEARAFKVTECRTANDRRTVHDQIVEAAEIFRAVVGFCGGFDSRLYLPDFPSQSVDKEHECSGFLRVVTNREEAFVPAPKLMQIWHCNVRYLERNGTPKLLPLKGEVSLESLLGELKCTLDVVAVKDAMVAAGLVEVKGRGFLRPLSRVVIGEDEVAARQALYSLKDLLRVLEHNLAERDRKSRIFQRFIYESKIPAARVEEFKRHFEIQAMAFLTSIEEWMTSAEKAAASDEPMEGINVHLFLAPFNGLKVTSPETWTRGEKRSQLRRGKRGPGGPRPIDEPLASGVFEQSDPQ